MEDEIREYMNCKWMLHAIYRENGYIEQHSENDNEFERLFFHENNLSYLTEILKGGLEYQCFDNAKLHNIKTAMKYFIEKYKNNEEKEETVKHCTQILKLTKHPKGKSIKYFYIDQYTTRYQTPCDKVTPEIMLDIDKQMLLDIYYLNCLWKLDENGKPLTKDIQFLKSINMIIKDCPEIVCEESMNLYIKNILEKNKELEEYETSGQFKELNDSLADYLNQINDNSDLLEKQMIRQTMFSLIFEQDMDDRLRKMMKMPNKGEFFEQTQFDVLCDYIMNYKEKCMFDSNIRENIRKILHAFLSENKNLTMNYTLNELKTSLNVIEDEEFRQKNLEFYKNIGEEYMQPMISNDHEYINGYKNMINLYIRSTIEILVNIVDDKRDYSWGAEIAYTPYFINFIINNYELIRENPVYMKKIEDLLYANLVSMEIKKEPKIRLDNHKMQKKVKSLYK